MSTAREKQISKTVIRDYCRLFSAFCSPQPQGPALSDSLVCSSSIQPSYALHPSTSLLFRSRYSANHFNGFSGSSIASCFIPSRRNGVTFWFRYTRTGLPCGFGWLGGAATGGAGCGDPRAAGVCGRLVVGFIGAAGIEEGCILTFRQYHVVNKY
jgi:hypothetical protein